MPILACRTCGRVLYATSALDTLFQEERRCPRCGASLDYERRGGNRRQIERRTSAADNGAAPADGPPDGIERRAVERRQTRRRRDDGKVALFASA